LDTPSYRSELIILRRRILWSYSYNV